MTLFQEGLSLVIFDLDGTLIDAFADITNAVNYIRELNDLPPLQTDDVKLYVGHGARQLVEGVLNSTEPEFIDKNLALLVKYYEDLEQSGASQARPYDGVIETVEWLREHGIKTAIATNKPHSVTVRLIEQLGIGPLFDVVLGESSAIPRKPAPDMLNEIMKLAGATAPETLMVGDTVVDIASARAAGVKVAVVTYGQQTEDVLALDSPDLFLQKMPDLVTVMQV